MVERVTDIWQLAESTGPYQAYLASGSRWTGGGTTLRCTGAALGWPLRTPAADVAGRCRTAVVEVTMDSELGSAPDAWPVV